MSHSLRREGELDKMIKAESTRKLDPASVKRRKSIRSIILKPIIEKELNKIDDSTRNKWKKRLKIPNQDLELDVFSPGEEKNAVNLSRINSRISEEYNKYLAKMKINKLDMNW